MASRTIYEVMHELSAGKVIHHSPADTEEAAQAEIDRFTERQTARGYPPKRMWVETKEVDVDFVVPDKGQPKDRYWVSTEPIDNGPGHWDSTRVTVHESVPGDRVVGTYVRNYRPLQTFHPFRQLRDGVWRDYALIAPEYTRTSVMDLATGAIIAREPWPVADADSIGSDGTVHWRKGDPQPGWGFCPVEFYVPDWWEIHDEGFVVGSYVWDEFRGDRPSGEFGFVAGCVWGDDSSWKIQYLDLSRISAGMLGRDDRFGYIELPDKVSLADAVTYWPASDRFGIAVACTYNHAGKQTYGPGAREED